MNRKLLISVICAALCLSACGTPGKKEDTKPERSESVVERVSNQNQIEESETVSDEEKMAALTGYFDSADASYNLDVIDAGGGSYNVSIGIERLGVVSGGGNYENGRIVFSSNEEGRGLINGYIEPVIPNNEVRLIIDRSDWDYLEGNQNVLLTKLDDKGAIAKMVGNFETDGAEDDLKVIDNKDRSYNIEIGVFRLGFMDNLTGYFDYEAGQIKFGGTDPSGGWIEGYIEPGAEPNHVTFVFTDSTWKYLPGRTEFDFEKKS